MKPKDQLIKEIEKIEPQDIVDMVWKNAKVQNKFGVVLKEFPELFKQKAISTIKEFMEGYKLVKVSAKRRAGE